MKNLFIALIVCITFASCSVFYTNYNNNQNVKKLRIGMSINEVTYIMGNDYTLETSFQEPEGTVEILKYLSSYGNDYLLHFLNGNLSVIEQYYRPVPPPQAPSNSNHNHD